MDNELFDLREQAIADNKAYGKTRLREEFRMKPVRAPSPRSGTRIPTVMANRPVSGWLNFLGISNAQGGQ